MTSMTLITREFSHHFLCSQETSLWLVYRHIAVHVIAPCFKNVPNEENNVSQVHCCQNRRHKPFRTEAIANEDSLALVLMDAKFTLWAQQFYPIHRFWQVSPIISASTVRLQFSGLVGLSHVLFLPNEKHLLLSLLKSYFKSTFLFPWIFLFLFFPNPPVYLL